MNELSFSVLGAHAELHAAVPTIVLGLRIENAGAPVHALALRCQVRIEPNRRRYDEVERHKLYELFGDAPQWGDSLKPFVWTHLSCVLAGFAETTEAGLALECSYDLEVAGARYLHSLGPEGEIPLVLLFSGTVFTNGENGFVAQPIPWDREASFRLPVSLWREVMDHYFPDSGWLRVRRSTIDALFEYKASQGFLTPELALEHLLKRAEAGEA